MPNTTRLILLYGGRSGEHEISLISAASVLKHLDAENYEIIPVGMDKQGRFYLNEYQTLLEYQKALPVKTEHSKVINGFFSHGQLAIQADVVFPVVHGPLYEDGCLQGLLELAGVPYVGCSVLSSAIGMDKDIARRLVKQLGLHSAGYCVVSKRMSADEKLFRYEEMSRKYHWPLFVKPCSLGSSVGIHKAKDMKALATAVEDALHYDEHILIEEYIQGREIELAVLESELTSSAPLVSLPGEICTRHKDGFYSYSAKYIESSETELIAPTNLESVIKAQITQAAADIFTCLKCEGLARVDFFVQEATGKIFFNEINTLPGFTEVSMFPKLWEASGMHYSALLNHLIRLAQLRFESRQQLVTHYQ